METFDPYQHFGFLTHRVSRLISHIMQTDQTSVSLAFPSSCIGLLAELWQKDGRTQTELGKALIKNKSSINQMIKALEDDGMIYKRKNEYDKRSHQIFLTKRGEEFKSKIQFVSKEVEEKHLSSFPAHRIEEAKEVLAHLYAQLLEKNNSS